MRIINENRQDVGVGIATAVSAPPPLPLKQTVLQQQVVTLKYLKYNVGMLRQYSMKPVLRRQPRTRIVDSALLVSVEASDPIKEPVLVIRM